MSMIKYSQFIFLNLILLFVISCERTKTAQIPSALEFDITQKYQNKTFDINDLAEIEYLVLQSRDSFLYTHFSYLSDNYILTYNNYDGSYIFYNRKGEPISVVSRMGQGPEEYIHSWKQIYSEKEDNLYVFSYPNKIQVYDRNGNYKKTLSLMEEDPSVVIDAFYDFNEEYLLCHNKQSKETKDFFLLSKTDGSKKDVQIHSDKPFDPSIKKEIDKTSTYSVIFDVSYAIRDSSAFILNTYSSDTLYSYSDNYRLSPRFILKPSVQLANPPYLVSGFIESKEYSFFSVQRMEDSFSDINNEEDDTKGFVYDKKSKCYFEIEVLNKDFTDQKLLITPSSLTSRIGECSSNPKIGILVLRSKLLSEADEKGKLRGKLKKVFDSLEDEDPFVLMILKFT